MGATLLKYVLAYSLFLLPLSASQAQEGDASTAGAEKASGKSVVGEAPYRFQVLVGDEGERQKMVSPESIAADAEGNLYIVDGHSARLRKLGTDRRVAWEIDGREWGGDGFLAPSAVGVYSGFDIYLLDVGKREIVHLNGRGEILGPIAAATLDDPKALALTRTGKLAVYDASSAEVVVLSPSGTLLWSFKPEGFHSRSHMGMAVRDEDEICLYVKGSNTVRLYHFMGGLERVWKPTLPGGGRPKIASIDCGGDGKTLVLDADARGLYVFDRLGNLLLDMSDALSQIGYDGPGEVRRRGDALFVSDVRGEKVFELKVP